MQTSEASSSKSKSSCPLMCSVLLHQEDDTSAGSSYHVLWLGGTSQVDVRVFASSAVEHVEIREGQPHVFGDEALEGGDANVQTAERVPAGEPAPTVGAKVLAGASQTRTVEDVFFGQWALVNEKQVCQFSLVLACAGIGLAQSACSQLSPVPCEHARISWEAPDGSGTTASSTFFRGTAPGTYTFTVDRKADAFAAPLVAPTGTEVQAFEHRSYLTAADVPLPPAPE